MAYSDIDSAGSPAASSSRGGHRQVWHTLTACTRCRKRKTKCDANLPRCGPCEKNDADCIYWDAAKGREMPRSYVVDLQRRVRQLEHDIDELKRESDSTMPIEDLVSRAGLVKIRENAESRFLGPSSGIAITRLVMELAKSISHTRTIKEIVPEEMAKGVKQRFAEEAAKPISKLYPSTSAVAAPDLPSQDLTNRLVDEFLKQAQTLYPIFHEPTFRRDVRDVYNGSTDPYQNFALRMVISLSMHKTDPRWTGLADSFYLAALKYLESTIRLRNLGTLQCFALIAIYSLATPTRTASYWVVGLAAKMLQEMRMTDEATITCDENGNPLDALEVDMRRRLFYILVSMELGLAHSLGRPSSFSVTYDHNDVKFYSDVDDTYISAQGISPEARPTFKKQMSIHFNQMRWLQLEIRHTLYLKKRAQPADDKDPWFGRMEEKVETWMKNYPKPEDGNGFPEEWFRVRYNTIIIFLFRPSPQVPEPSIYGVRRCFDSAVKNIRLQRAQIDNKAADVTWIFAQQLFMAINIVLWTLSYSELRLEHPREEVTRDLQTALDAIFWASTKWPGVESALMLYSTLVESCLKAYDGDAEASYGAASPLNRATATSPQFVDTPPPFADTPSTSNSIPLSRPLTGVASHFSRPQSLDPDLPPTSRPGQSSLSPNIPNSQALHYGSTPSSQMAMPPSPFSQASYDTSAFFNPLPSPLPYSLDQTTQPSLLSGMMQNGTFLMGSNSDGVVPYFNLFEPPVAMEGINLTQQEELLHNLETYGFRGPPSISDVSSLTGPPSVTST